MLSMTNHIISSREIAIMMQMNGKISPVHKIDNSMTFKLNTIKISKSKLIINSKSLNTITYSLSSPNKVKSSKRLLKKLNLKGFIKKVTKNIQKSMPNLVN